jgi:hypothetical protein
VKKISSREKYYGESGQPIDHDALARHYDTSDAMVPLPGDHFPHVEVDKFYKDLIEKRIEIKYRRFSFSESGTS